MLHGCCTKASLLVSGCVVCRGVCVCFSLDLFLGNVMFGVLVVHRLQKLQMMNVNVVHVLQVYTFVYTVGTGMSCKCGYY